MNDTTNNNTSNEEGSLNTSQSETKSAAELLSEQKEHYLGIIADYENRMKRTMQDAQHSISITLERLLSDLIPLMQNISDAAALVQDEAKIGLDMIEKNMRNTLNKYGIQEIAVQIGDDFDPHAHQAISAIESEAYSEGKILEIKQSGYSFNKKIILPAVVVISK